MYLYNGKELDTDFGLNWYHYGARMYDPAIGRFTGVDPISDKFAWVSTYNYAENEPIANIDLHGLQRLHYGAASAYSGEGAKFAKENPKTAAAVGVGMIAGPIALVAAAEAGTAATGAFIANEIKDEVLSQATGGASDVLDITKAGAKLLKSGLDGLKGLNNLSDEGLDAYKGGMKFDNISGGDASSFISTEFDAQSAEKIKTFETALKNGDMSIFSEPIFTTQNAGSTFILDGHHRIQAAINVGAENVPIVRLSPNEAQQLFPNKTQQILDGEFN